MGLVPTGDFRIDGAGRQCGVGIGLPHWQSRVTAGVYLIGTHDSWDLYGRLGSATPRADLTTGLPRGFVLAPREQYNRRRSLGSNLQVASRPRQGKPGLSVKSTL